MSDSQLSCYYLSKGKLLQSQGQLEKAVTTLLQAVKVNDKSYLNRIYTTLGTTYLDLHKDEKAVEILKRKINFSIKVYGANSEEAAEGYFWLARACLLMKKLKQSKQLFHKSIAISKSCQSELPSL